MKKILVLGPGCPNCERVAERAREAIEQLGLDCELEKITNMAEYTNYGLMITPGLVVEGRLRLQGRVPTVEEIKSLLQEQLPMQ